MNDFSNEKSLVKMGIIRFNAWLRKKISSLPENKVYRNDVPKDIDLLCFDFNSIIHNAAQKIYKYGSSSGDDVIFRKKLFEEYKSSGDFVLQRMKELHIKEILKTLDDIIGIVNPQKRVIIAVDGVVPESKMVQQRQRRFKSVAGRDETVFFDNNSISPGTDLMEEIESRVIAWMNSRKSPDIILSGHLTPGEGEHKIFEYLRGLRGDTELRTVIYGMDTDLIMLSLLEEKKIYLMRESFHKKGMFDYISISGLKETLDELMENPDAHKDFVMIIYLIGNDFVPHMPGLEDRDSCIDTMIEVYGNLKLHFTRGSDVDWSNLSKFIVALSEREPALLYEVHIQGMRYPMTSLEKNIHGEEFDYGGFRSDWYKNAFASKASSAVTDIYSVPVDEDQLITKMCFQYCSMISWMFKYYSEGTSSVRFNHKYMFHHTPILSDLASFLESNNGSFSLWEKEPLRGESIMFSALHQLVYILPPQSMNLLPKEFQQIYLQRELIDYFPKSVAEELEGKRADYEVVIFVPFIDIRRIIHACNLVPLTKERAAQVISRFERRNEVKLGR